MGTQKPLEEDGAVEELERVVEHLNTKANTSLSPEEVLGDDTLRCLVKALVALRRFSSQEKGRQAFVRAAKIDLRSYLDLSGGRASALQRIPEDVPQGEDFKARIEDLRQEYGQYLPPGVFEDADCAMAFRGWLAMVYKKVVKPYSDNQGNPEIERLNREEIQPRFDMIGTIIETYGKEPTKDKCPPALWPYFKGEFDTCEQVSALWGYPQDEG